MTSRKLARKSCFQNIGQERIDPKNIGPRKEWLKNQFQKELVEKKSPKKILAEQMANKIWC